MRVRSRNEIGGEEDDKDLDIEVVRPSGIGGGGQDGRPVRLASESPSPGLAGIGLVGAVRPRVGGVVVVVVFDSLA